MRHFSRLHPILLLKKQESLISEIHIYEERQPNGQWLKSIKFKLPIIEEDMEMSLDSDTHVDTALGGCITLPVGTAINRSVETCGLFIFVGTHASISVPPWNLNVIRPSLWTVTVVAPPKIKNAPPPNRNCTPLMGFYQN